MSHIMKLNTKYITYNISYKYHWVVRHLNKISKDPKVSIQILIEWRLDKIKLWKSW